MAPREFQLKINPIYETGNNASLMKFEKFAVKTYTTFYRSAQSFSHKATSRFLVM